MPYNDISGTRPYKGNSWFDRYKTTMGQRKAPNFERSYKEYMDMFRSLGRVPLVTQMGGGNPYDVGGGVNNQEAWKRAASDFVRDGGQGAPKIVWRGATQRLTPSGKPPMKIDKQNARIANIQKQLNEPRVMGGRRVQLEKALADAQAQPIPVQEAWLGARLQAAEAGAGRAIAQTDRWRQGLEADKAKKAAVAALSDMMKDPATPEGVRANLRDGLAMIQKGADAEAVLKAITAMAAQSQDEADRKFAERMTLNEQQHGFRAEEIDQRATQSIRVREAALKMQAEIRNGQMDKQFENQKALAEASATRRDAAGLRKVMDDTSRLLLDAESIINAVDANPTAAGSLSEQQKIAVEAYKTKAKAYKTMLADYATRLQQLEGAGPAGGGRGQLTDPNVWQSYLDRAGGNPQLAEQLAMQDGWE